MEDKNTLDPEIIPEKPAEEEEFHHINNPAAGIKPIVKKYLSTPIDAEQKGNKLF